MRLILALAAAAVALAVSVAALAQDKGYTLVVDRQTYTLDEKAHWVALIEAERRANDAQAARNGGRIDVSYHASLQKLEIVEAETVKADGRRLSVGENKIIDIAPQASHDVSFYTDLRTRSIVFPDLQAGDSIRYIYRLTRLDDTWPGFSWEFVWMPSVRVELAERILDHPSSLAVTVEARQTEHRVEQRGDRVRHILSWSNKTPADPEAGTTSPFDWGPRGTLSTLKSYAEIGDHYAPLHSDAARVTPEIEALAKRIADGSTDPREVAHRLYDWVAANIRYVGVEVGQGMLRPASASETLRNRYGDCKAHVALLAALLAARSIESEPALINITQPRYELAEPPVPSFNHVILHLPGLGLYVDSTAAQASFGVLPWSHYDKPAVLAAPGGSRTARLPAERADDNVAETYTTAVIGPDGHVSGTTREIARGAIATDLRSYAAQVTAAKATTQLRHFGTPGSGRWTKTALSPSAPEAMVTGEFDLADAVDLEAGEALHPPVGLRFLVRPGAFLVGVHDTPHKHPFRCHAGRQVETIEVRLPDGMQPSRLPSDRHWTTSVAEYRSSYAFADGVLRVRREFVAHPESQVCQPAASEDLQGLASRVRRDLGSVVVFEPRS
jgi:transglutaminase-like putative cysteine protease